MKTKIIEKIVLPEVYENTINECKITFDECEIALQKAEALWEQEYDSRRKAFLEPYFSILHKFSSSTIEEKNDAERIIKEFLLLNPCVSHQWKMVKETNMIWWFEQEYCCEICKVSRKEKSAY